ncbi:MAG: enoyl-CoA hydratase-related protein [Acidimicrobiales bacterium]|jgi:enoyl-CoA hydratase|nr:enoyl-CoA hydratase-related protein [Acidimicrobiales bacterium]
MSTIEVTEPEPAIAVIRLNRPERLNAMSFELVADLHTALDGVANDTECKVVVLTGAGRAFCAGLDLKDWGRPPEPGEHPHVHSGIDPQTFMSNLTTHLRDLPQVVVAAVNGAAFGGGLALACAADIRLASTTARFCSAFIRTGLSGTDIGITYLLPRLIGNARAFDLILTGRDIDADEALQMGLVSKLAEPEGLEDLAMAYARMMAGYTKSGLRTTKEVLWHNTAAPSLESALALEIRNQNLLQFAPDVREFLDAYRAKTTGGDR